MNLSYFEIWHGIDRLAEQRGLSPSALAQKAGLDPTAFNKSKRIGPDGRKRWLSMESLNKVLESTQTSFIDFMALAGQSSVPTAKTTIPLMMFSQIATDTFLDEMGLPKETETWDGLDIPARYDASVYAIELTKDAFAPVYRAGDHLIVTTQVEIRKNDRIVVKTIDEAVYIGELLRKTARQTTLKIKNTPEEICTFNSSDILWMARILWVSQ